MVHQVLSPIYVWKVWELVEPNWVKLYNSLSRFMVLLVSDTEGLLDYYSCPVTFYIILNQIHCRYVMANAMICRSLASHGCQKREDGWGLGKELGCNCIWTMPGWCLGIYVNLMFEVTRISSRLAYELCNKCSKICILTCSLYKAAMNHNFQWAC